MALSLSSQAVELYDSIAWADPSSPLRPPPPVPKPRFPESPWNALSEIIPGLFLTCERTAQDRDRMSLMGCRLILRMNSDISDAPFEVFAYDNDEMRRVERQSTEDEFFAVLREEIGDVHKDRGLLGDRICIRNVAAEDSPVFDIASYFHELSCLIELVLSARKRLGEAHAAELEAGDDIRLPSIVVHCMAGVSRSAAVVLAYLMRKFRIRRNDALKFVQAARPVADPNQGFMSQLSLWENNKGNRIVDDMTSSTVARELLAEHTTGELADMLKDQLRVLTKSARMEQDRSSFGLLLKHIILLSSGGGSCCDVGGTAGVVDMVASCIKAVLVETLLDEVYIDCPAFFRCFVEVCTSVKRHCPMVLCSKVLSDKHDDDNVQSRHCTTEDALHELTLSHMATHRLDSWNAAEVLCKYLRAISTTQLPSDSCQDEVKEVGFSRAVMFVCDGPAIVEAVRLPQQAPVAISFCFLHIFAMYCEGFLEWGVLDDIVPPTVATRSAVANIFRRLRESLRFSFLVARWDGAVGAVGVKTQRRWSSCTSDPTAPSYLHFLKEDIEVTVFEALEVKVMSSNIDTTSHDTMLAFLVKDVLMPIWHKSLADLRQAYPTNTCSLAVQFTEERLAHKLLNGVEAFVTLHLRLASYIRDVCVVVDDAPPMSASRRSTSPPGEACVPQLVVMDSALGDSSSSSLRSPNQRGGDDLAQSQSHLSSTTGSAAAFSASEVTVADGIEDYYFCLQLVEDRLLRYLIKYKRDVVEALRASITSRQQQFS